ncbi:unnamed protein product [Leptidea sinapis]|uniref:Uncharacterized protein n=1 Tax=Leptidea sinapis TaxID=189913 RepID=A0A5E4QGP4_9NEOP|nr:unnamed protein product [Leptidea sinapis]
MLEFHAVCFALKSLARIVGSGESSKVWTSATAIISYAEEVETNLGTNSIPTALKIDNLCKQYLGYGILEELLQMS